MAPEAVTQIEEQLEDEGVVSLNDSEVTEFFDSRARRLVNMSGGRALKRIRAGKCGPDLAWSELTLLSALLK